MSGGQGSKARIHKNKVGAPWGECEFDIIWGKGVDPITDALIVGKEIGVVGGGSGYYEFGGHKWHGLNAANVGLWDFGLVEELREAVLKAIK